MATRGSGIVFGGLSPHPPLVIPEVGGGELRRVSSTVDALRRLGSELVTAAPETVIVVGPHGPVARRAFIALASPRLRGDFAAFGAPEVSLSFQNDLRLLEAVTSEARAAGLEVTHHSGRSRGKESWETIGEIDYATLVPLYYLREAGYDGQVLVISMAFTGYKTCFRFGQAIAAAAAAAAKPAALLASGDLSHRLIRGAPAGYDPLGAVFDKYLMEAIEQGDAQKLINVDPELVERAGECGLRPVLIMLGGVLDAGLVPEVLSYEGPFGVGYGVAVFRRPEGATGAGSGDPLVRLAREAVDSYVRHGEVMDAPGVALPGSPPRAGCFVSLKKGGQLRGCIGTIAPTRESLAEEIVRNAIAAATEDPRFPPLAPGELAGLEVSVDVLGEPEPIEGPGDLDPKRYGVIVEKEHRRGLLLPDLEGVDTVAEQVSIASRKAGLRPGAPGLKLYRFEVTRHR